MRLHTCLARAALIGGVSALALSASVAAAQNAETVSPNTGTAQSSTTGGAPQRPSANTGPAAAAQASGIEEIVVTAQRQSQSLQDVPIAVSAFSGAQLARQNITNTTLLQQVLPNISFTKTNFSDSNFSIRGVGNNAIGTSADSGVGVALNDMPIVNPRLFEIEYYDLDRIEVLRGPQGTLFGRNASSGVINVITHRPDNDLGAAAEFEYGNYNSKKVTGDINVPFSTFGVNDLGGFRVSGLYLKRDGFTNNLFNGGQIDGRDEYSIRAALRLTPGPSTTIDITGQFFRENDDRLRSQKQLCTNDPTGILGCQPGSLSNGRVNANSTLANVLTSPEFLRLNGFPAFVSNLVGNSSIYNPATSNIGQTNPADPRTVYTDFQPTYRSDERIIQGRLEQRFDKATLTIIGGYEDNFVNSRQDYDLQPGQPINPALGPTIAAVFPAKAGNPLFQGSNICVSNVSRANVGYIGDQVLRCGPNVTEYDQSDQNNDQWSIEAHLDTKFDGPLNFLVGGIYLHAAATSDYFVSTSLLDLSSLLLTGPAPGGLTSPFFNNETLRYTLNAYAGFGEVYYKPTDNLKLTVGARYTTDIKRSIDALPAPLLAEGFAPFGTQSVQDRQTYRNARLLNQALTGRVVLDWKPVLTFTDDTLIYASYSRGYKGGGINPAFNPAVFQEPTTFGPEHINAFEIGTKNRFKGGLFQANLTGFYYDYKGLQVSRIINRSSFNDNTNATVYGVEGEFVIAPTPNLLVNITASALHTSIGDLSLSDARDPSGGRNDTVIIKDITNAANCVVTPTAAGSAAGVGLAQTTAFVNAVNAGINAQTGAGLQPAVAVPGTRANGAYSICSSLAGAIAATGAPFQYVTNVGAGGAVSLTLPDGNAVSLKGKQLPNSPTTKFSVGAQYTFDLPRDFNLVLHGDVNFTGNQFGRDFNDFADRIAPYEIVNAQLQLNAPNNRYYVRAFVTNAFNTQALTGLYVTDATSGLFTNVFTVEPRRFGIAIGAKL